jgi:hypothetical protein
MLMKRWKNRERTGAQKQEVQDAVTQLEPKYRVHRRRDLGWPRKRWRDQWEI